MIRIVTQKDHSKLIKNLKEKYNLTILDAKGKRGKVKVIFSVIDKKELKKIIKTINETNPKAFYSIEDVRYAQENNLLQIHEFPESSKPGMKGK